MDQKTQTPAKKFASAIIEAADEFLKVAGFVKVNGVHVCADDLKADAS